MDELKDSKFARDRLIRFFLGQGGLKLNLEVRCGWFNCATKGEPELDRHDENCTAGR